MLRLMDALKKVEGHEDTKHKEEIKQFNNEIEKKINRLRKLSKKGSNEGVKAVAAEEIF